MRPIKERRKDFMDYLTQVIDLLDPSGENSASYHEMWDHLSDTEFNKMIEDFFNNPKANFYLEIVEYERDLTMPNVENCAKFMNVPLFERVAMPYLVSDGANILITPEPMAVGYIHEKRMQQTLLKKTGGSISIKKKNPKSGQVIGTDKNARNTDTESYALIAQGAIYTLKELMGPRADDEGAKAQLYNAISAKGFVSMDEIEDDRYNKTALNTFNTSFLMQGITTNIMAPLDIIPGPRPKNYKTSDT